MLQRQFRCFAGQSGASYGSVRVLHEDAYFVGNVAGTVGGMVAAASIGNIAAGTSSLVACGSLAQKAAKLYTAIDTVAGIANATSNRRWQRQPGRRSGIPADPDRRRPEAPWCPHELLYRRDTRGCGRSGRRGGHGHGRRRPLFSL